MKWTRQVTSSQTVNTTFLKVDLGRVMYVAGALEYEHPLSLDLCIDSFPCIP